VGGIPVSRYLVGLIASRATLGVNWVDYLMRSDSPESGEPGEVPSVPVALADTEPSHEKQRLEVTR